MQQLFGRLQQLRQGGSPGRLPAHCCSLTQATPASTTCSSRWPRRTRRSATTPRCALAGRSSGGDRWGPKLARCSACRRSWAALESSGRPRGERPRTGLAGRRQQARFSAPSALLRLPTLSRHSRRLARRSRQRVPSWRARALSLLRGLHWLQHSTWRQGRRWWLRSSTRQTTLQPSSDWTFAARPPFCPLAVQGQVRASSTPWSRHAPWKTWTGAPRFAAASSSRDRSARARSWRGRRRLAATRHRTAPSARVCLTQTATMPALARPAAESYGAMATWRRRWGTWQGGGGIAHPCTSSEYPLGTGCVRGGLQRELGRQS